MKLFEIVTLYNNLTGISNKKLPVALSYAVSRNLDTLGREIETYNKERTKLCEEAADKDENGKARIEDDKYVISDENMIRLNRDITELMQEDASVDIHKIPEEVIDKLDDPRYDALTPADMRTLGFMIKE